MPLNKLPDDKTRGADRAHVWFNVILGFTLSASLPSQNTWWVDPAFDTARAFPHSQAVWAGALAIATSVYTYGSFKPYGKPRRGAIIIVGASLCSAWYLALAMCLIRQQYIDPQHVGSMWPLVLMFLAVLYAHRAVLYANIFTGSRWGTDPFQMYPIAFLMLVSITQVVVGVSPQSIQAHLDPNTVLSVAGANLVGGTMTMTGLHLRHVESGLWLELFGYSSLILTLLVYLFNTLHSQDVPIATIGFSLSEGFLAASFHRSVQIGIYKYSVYRGPPWRANIYRHALEPRGRGAVM